MGVHDSGTRLCRLRLRTLGVTTVWVADYDNELPKYIVWFHVGHATNARLFGVDR